MGYIYILTNMIKMKKYVGMTTRTVQDRLCEYKNSAKLKNKRLINKVIEKYGWENFEVESFEFSNYELLVQEEIFIKRLNTIAPNGYNILPGGRYKSLDEKMIERKRIAFIEMCNDEKEDDIVPKKERKATSIYDFVDKECKKYTNGYSNFYEELANDALDLAGWLADKSDDLPSIKYEIVKNIKANYKRRRECEPYAAKMVEREQFDFEFDKYREGVVNKVITEATAEDRRKAIASKNNIKGK